MKIKRSILLNDKNYIGDTCKPYVVAELNTSHFGDIKLAKKMIYEAKQSGCDCVKLQSWTSDSLYSKNFYKKNPISKKFFDKYSLNNQKLKKLSTYSKKIGISFSSTPYSEDEVDFLVKECNPAFIKVASMDLNNHIFLKYIAKKKVPIILSTGMGTEKEIYRAVKVIKENGQNKICILHCVSLYPMDYEVANLKNISMLRKKFKNIPIGYSDHSVGSVLPVAAISLGACLIEKHFTLDNKKIGMDNQMATEPDTMKKLISECKTVFKALGSEKRKLSKQEFQQKKKMRRSLFVKEEIKKNEIITMNKIILRRPGTGISPDKIKKVLGKKVKKDLKEGSFIKMSFIKT